MNFLKGGSLQRNKILYYLKLIQDKNIPHSKLREFIEICIRISLYILNKKYYHLRDIFSSAGVNFNEISVDAVAPLFINSSEINLTGIEHSIIKWQKPFISESDAHFFIFKVISKRIDQTIQDLLKEVDPIYGKLLYNILYKAKKLGYKKVVYCGESYLIEADKEKITGNVIDKIQFEMIPLKLSSGKLNIDIESIISYIKKNTDFFPAIPITFLISRIKRIYSRIILNSNDSGNVQFFMEVKTAFDNSLKIVSKKLTDTYVRKEILTKSESELIKKALRDIAIDLADSGSKSCLEDYLTSYFTNLSRNEIKDKYHNILDYLVKLFKKEMIKEINGIKFPNY